MPGKPDAHRHLPLTPLSASILLTLADGPRHGYAIIKEMETQTGGLRVPGAGSLYAALQRMVDEGLLEEREPPSADDDPRRRYYALTSQGRDVIKAEMLRMARMISIASEKRLVPELPRPQEG